MRFLFTYILILLNFIILSQSNPDSLINILSSTNDVKIIAKTCYEISYDFGKFEKDTILHTQKKGHRVLTSKAMELIKHSRRIK